VPNLFGETKYGKVNNGKWKRAYDKDGEKGENHNGENN